ncbi:aspartyl-tRNA(Asn)/glutamyl-tRNA(Gln) amidotransferase subunit A [Nocardia transvalensis]|uniref:Aspartyl-tRNA(Asn)/glutamyl-tRNA(Gln) amidotransferase subunit A n=1 Tax=Nocardia transvalensis TaxID=37333 RepID=A0A7W9P8J4_9NOCA|nr:amidase [Nocardia transvalensis]MBB5911335.1 aspartyl-tRNA(Asn)/glutamyl-tRNA(Gln) amidotransferase subunit A [Nocardia transvalensis]
MTETVTRPASFETVTDASAALRRGDVTATDLVDGALATTDDLGVYLARFDERARARAADIDRRLADGESLPPLAGIPVGVKDILAHTEGPTTAQSLVLDPAWAAGIGDCAVVRRLERAGAVVTGKTSTMEFAIGVPDPDKPFPVPRCAWDTDRWAGGSSSGSGSGVAAGIFLASIGTDTAGSIRIPAAFNGVTGLKPTFGRVPKSGVVPLGYTLDHVGPLARSAADCALLLSVLAGPDADDPYSAAVPVADYPAALTGDLRGVTVGVDDLDRFADGGIDPEQPALFAAALDALRAAGATVVPVEVPMYPELVAIDLVVMLAEAHAYHRATLRDRWTDYGRGTRIVLAGGAAVTGPDYVQAQRVRRLAQQRMSDLLTRVDLVVTPTGHLGAPPLSSLDPLQPLGALSSLHTPYWNPLGNPTLAVPIGLSADATPLSMSISGRYFDEATVLRAGDAFQRRTAHHLAKKGVR